MENTSTSKIFSIVLGILVLGLIVGLLLTYQKDDGENEIEENVETEQVENNEITNESAVDTTTTTTTTQTVVETSTSYTLVEVATHNTEANCWTAINGGVYDLGAWVKKHPGGDKAILSLCGIDGSSAFNTKHGGAELQLSILAGFKIGNLK